MARPSELREWVNVSVAALVFFATCVGTYFVWQANQMHNESVEAITRKGSDCKFLAFDLENSEMILCWAVQLTNNSVERVTINDIVAANEDIPDDPPPSPNSIIFLHPPSFLLVDNKLLSSNNQPLSVPFVIESHAPLVVTVVIRTKILQTESEALAATLEQKHFNQWSVTTLRQVLWIHDTTTSGHWDHGKPLCVIADDTDEHGRCRKHFRIVATTGGGKEVVVETGFPE